MTLRKILIIGVIIIVIFWLFNELNNNNNEPFDNMNDNPNIEYIQNIKHKKNKKIEKPSDDSYFDSISSSPVSEKDLEVIQYLNTHLKDYPKCVPNIQTTKEYNTDFFNFQNYIHQNSSMTYDPVDKVTDLYLSGQLNVGNGKKISEIYDGLTAGINLYEDECVRLPKLDNTMNDGYDFSMLSGMHNVRDEWVYGNEY